MIDQLRPLLLLLLLALSLAATFGEISEPVRFSPHKLLPIDEGQKDPSFQVFRQKLMDAVKRKDAIFLLSIVDPQVKNSFGGDDGIQQFRKIWNPGDPKGKIWDDLRDALRLGGTFGGEGASKAEFCAPYVFARFPDDYDALEYSAIIDKDVRVRNALQESAPVVATLSYEIVRTLSDEDSGKQEARGSSRWIHIGLANGREGFVPGQSIRSPIDYRACFKKTGNKWLLTQFVAGD